MKNSRCFSLCCWIPKVRNYFRFFFSLPAGFSVFSWGETKRKIWKKDVRKERPWEGIKEWRKTNMETIIYSSSIVDTRAQPSISECPHYATLLWWYSSIRRYMADLSMDDIFTDSWNSCICPWQKGRSWKHLAEGFPRLIVRYFGTVMVVEQLSLENRMDRRVRASSEIYTDRRIIFSFFCFVCFITSTRYLFFFLFSFSSPFCVSFTSSCFISFSLFRCTLGCWHACVVPVVSSVCSSQHDGMVIAWSTPFTALTFHVYVLRVIPVSSFVATELVCSYISE